MDLSSIYSQLIMEHNKSGHNKKEIDNPDHTERGHNPSCGDDLTISVKFNGEILEDISFMGTGCAISEASASMMIDLIKGKTKKEAIEDIETFMSMIKKEIIDEEELEKLEDAIVLKNISNMPARVKCAVLAWHTLNEILKNRASES